MTLSYHFYVNSIGNWQLRNIVSLIKHLSKGIVCKCKLHITDCHFFQRHTAIQSLVLIGSRSLLIDVLFDDCHDNWCRLTSCWILFICFIFENVPKTIPFCFFFFGGGDVCHSSSASVFLSCQHSWSAHCLLVVTVNRSVCFIGVDAEIIIIIIVLVHVPKSF